jgi:ketosteroid isomerase-like protein
LILKAEEQTIRALEQRWRQALSAKDAAAVMGLNAEGGYYLPQGSDGYLGPEVVGKRWAGEFTGGEFILEREPKTIEIARAGDMVYETGTYKVSWDKPKERRKGQCSGNYVTVWKKVGGEWKLQPTSGIAARVSNGINHLVAWGNSQKPATGRSGEPFRSY